jgi:hypothetical protein
MASSGHELGGWYIRPASVQASHGLPGPRPTDAQAVDGALAAQQVHQEIGLQKEEDEGGVDRPGHGQAARHGTPKRAHIDPTAPDGIQDSDGVERRHEDQRLLQAGLVAQERKRVQGCEQPAHGDALTGC